MKWLIVTSAMMGLLICNGCLPFVVGTFVYDEIEQYRNPPPRYDVGPMKVFLEEDMRRRQAEATKKAQEECDGERKAKEEKAKEEKAKVQKAKEDALKKKAALEETQEN
jgi:hypothetical protein